MSKIAVVYWSGTGNTEMMAEAVLEGAKSAGAEASSFTPETFSPAKMDEFDAVAFGCPSMGDEELEETEFQPLFAECEPKLKGRRIALFGSYGWGDGEWMRSWEDKCRKDGAELVSGGVICNEEPGGEEREACRKLGKRAHK